MNFRCFAFLLLFLLNQEVQSGQLTGYPTSQENSSFYFDIQIKNSANHFNNLHTSNIYSQPSKIALTIEDLTEDELNNLLPEYQNHPRVIAQREKIIQAKYAAESNRSYCYYSFNFSGDNFTCLAKGPNEALELYNLELASRKEKAYQQKEQQQNSYKEQVPNVMNVDSDLTLYCQAYQTVELNNVPCEESNWVEVRRAQILEKRMDALSRYNRGCDIWQEQTYQILDKAQKALNSCSIKITKFLTCYGNEIQQTLHQEFVDIVHDAASLHFPEEKIPHTNGNISTTLLGFVETGQFYNQTGQISKAISCADFCWGLLDCNTFLLNNACQLTVAAAKGITRAGVNAFFKVIQPIRTISDMAHELTYLIALAGQHLQHAHDERQLTFKRMREQIHKDNHDLAMGTITQWSLVQRGFANFKDDGSQTIEQVYTVLNNTWESLNREKVLFATEKIFEAGTEMFITSKATQAMSMLLKNGRDSLKDIIQAGGGMSNFHDLPLNGGTLQAQIAYESIMAHEIARAELAACITVADAIDEISKLAPSLILIPNNSLSHSGSSGNITKSPADPLQAKFKIQVQEIDKIEDSVAKLDANKERHIMKPKHNWHKLLCNSYDWDGAQRLISKVMRNGTPRSDGVDVYIKSLKIGNEIVEVKYVEKIIDGICIGTAWIR